uniref:Uncharacterized protein n=2 Tax=Oryza TaxID=4527 RepID=Q2QXI3_ORYSJ|nr:hypothetical protein LOC_Os12g05950 [Oryza sativa Japonica Group]
MAGDNTITKLLEMCQVLRAWSMEVGGHMIVVVSCGLYGLKPNIGHTFHNGGHTRGENGNGHVST